MYKGETSLLSQQEGPDGDIAEPANKPGGSYRPSIQPSLEMYSTNGYEANVNSSSSSCTCRLFNLCLHYSDIHL